MNQPSILTEVSLKHHPRAERFMRVRTRSEHLCETLDPEDCMVQSMPDVSPTKWHLAHTTWFFETFILETAVESYCCFDPDYRVLFNSYYNSVGAQFSRTRRGILSRPSLAQIWDYRQHVDDAMQAWLGGDSVSEATARVMEIGLQHEQQHQELLLTDIKHVFSLNPLCPVYRQVEAPPSDNRSVPLGWIEFDESVSMLGHQASGFCYDNELPAHLEIVPACRLASRLATNAEYSEFVEDGGYQRPEFWLSAGWHTVNQQGWTHPLYWRRQDSQWHTFTLHGLRALEPNEPVCHVSYFEADAFARWRGSRLPTEAEWERASRSLEVEGNFVDNERFHPAPALQTDDPPGHVQQMYGDVWEWTSSPYTAYPGYQPPSGALGEYNGKFMCNQMVLRGGSCATSRTHIRPSYRNYFPPDARWQFSGIRLCQNLLNEGGVP